MKKKIYINTVLLAFSSVLLVSAFLTILFYNEVSNQVKSEIKNQSIFWKAVLNKSDNPVAAIHELDISGNEIRVSIISSDGEVLYDNNVDITKLENHLNREEIKAALESGEGESKRFSDTIGEETYYFALKLTNNLILRASKTTSSIYGIFWNTLPIVIAIILAIFICCNMIARRLTKRIIEPINSMDFEQDSVPYDELAPFIETIIHQKRQIKEQVAELDERSDTLKAIRDNMKEGLILLDKSGAVLSANKSVLKLFNVNRQIAGKNVIEITRNVEILDHISLALQGQNSDITLDISSRIMNVFFSPILDSGVLVLFLDITEKAKAEKLRREFSANVSHELKTPLTSICGYAEMVENGMVKPEDINRFSGKIKTESMRLISLINDIIRLSELDETDIKEMEQFPVHELAKSIVESLEKKADEHLVTLSLVCDDFVMNADRQMIYELLYNLIDNGIKYNKENGTVSIQISNRVGKVKISVSDTGIGIPRKDFDRIFERFYRVDKSRSKKTGGTGLGLSIVKHIVSYHGGTTTVESKEGVGTTICIEIFQR